MGCSFCKGNNATLEPATENKVLNLKLERIQPNPERKSSTN